MEALPAISSCLDLNISMPGSSGMIDLDINQVPEDGGEEQEQWTRTMTMNTNSSMDLDDHDDDHNSNNVVGGEGGARKKLRLSKDQSRFLEESFRQNHTLNTKQKEALAVQLQLKPRQVEVWFQNRRARSKLKQTEMECEYLKRWFTTLTEQNRWLHKEVEELRSLKVGPPTVLSPHTSEPLPASTLTMCPRCEHISTANPQPPASKPDTSRATRQHPSSSTAC